MGDPAVDERIEATAVEALVDRTGDANNTFVPSPLGVRE